LSQQYPPRIDWSHKKAVGLHCTNRSVVVMMQRMVVETIVNHRMNLCHLLRTIRNRKRATELLEAAIPMMHIPCPIASHIMALE
jgi:hypothetical protein